MGDIRFERAYQRVAEAADRTAALRGLSDEDVIAALAAATRASDPYLTNIIASEGMNRVHRKGRIVETAAEALLSQDLEGRLTYLNPAGEHLLGWRAEEVLGRDIHELIHGWRENGEPYPKEECPIHQVAVTGEPVRANETVLFRKDGTSFHAEQHAAPIVRNGEVEGVVVAFVDITERKSAEQALRYQNALLESQNEASLDGILVVDNDGRMVSFNQRFLEMWGLPADLERGADDLTTHLWAAEKTTDPDGFLASVERHYTHESEPGRDEVTLRDGRVFDRYGGPIIGPDGTRYGWLWSFRDITAYRDATRALEASEARKRAILEASLDAIVTIDAGSRIIEWNPAAEAILGHAREEVLGRDLADVIIPERFRDAHHAGVARYLATGVGPILAQRLELPALRADGTEFPSELTIVPIRVPGGPLFTGFLRDLTERKRAEENARDAAARAKALTDNANDGLFDWDIRTGQVTFSPRWRRLLGFEEDELPDVFETWIGRVHPDDRERARAAIDDFLTGRTATYDLEHRLRNKDGTYRWVLSRAALLRDETGTPVRLIGWNTDLTRMRRLGEAREQAARGELEGTTARLHALLAIADTALAHQGRPSLPAALATQVRDALEADTCTLFLLEPETAALRVAAATGVAGDEEALIGASIPLGEDAADRIVEEGEPLVVEDVRETDLAGPLISHLGLRAILGAPLLVEEKIIGAVQIGAHAPRRFRPEEVDLLRLAAERVALALARTPPGEHALAVPTRATRTGPRRPGTRDAVK